MEKKNRRMVHGECPQCACGDISFIAPQEMIRKYSGPEDEVEILCPSCGAKIKGHLVAEEEK